MGILDSLNDVLKNYNGSETQSTENAAEHFDQVARAAPNNVVAEGLAAAFRSDRTPAFGNLIGNLFSHSSGEQKAGILNHLLASVEPGVLTQVAGNALPTRLLSGAGQQVTPDQAQTVPGQIVQQLATQAEKSDPTIVDKASSFYAEHSTLVKTLGGVALSIALAKVAERQRAA